ncbi:hypothetical protein NFHSH190041_19940 [Shewanella sp. NFH-SH190041]|uniref:hypothetical protein n=1 Tax=Shewanella sp. NFH-SH190041 TaxID=2950245 RepID=UPI0021C4595C|nr:hypothetical protein [Shewanella sp. NFH-SH190041]BDM64542.1 hypothetical protein NFHSH190041_19940 [Shewanella sp. NFH-SH190041]
MRAGKLNIPAIHYQMHKGQSPSGAIKNQLKKLRSIKIGLDDKRSDQMGNTDAGDRKQGLNEYHLLARHHPKHRFRLGDYLEIRGEFLKVTAVDDLDRRQPVKVEAAYNPAEKLPKVSP